MSDMNWYELLTQKPTKTMRKPGSGPAHTKQWTTKDKRTLRVCDMDDIHLMNTIKFLERTCKKRLVYDLALAEWALDFVTGDIATYTAERHADSLSDVTLNDYLPAIYFDMVEEAEQRGLVAGCNPDDLSLGRKEAERVEADKFDREMDAYAAYLSANLEGDW